MMISGSTIFIKLDLVDAFNQIPIPTKYQKFTAFKSKFRVFQYTVMPFGLKNAPAIFQRMIDMVLGPLIGKCCIAYLDNILIFLPNCQQHTKDLTAVFKRLYEFNLKLKLSKCELYQDEVQFLGDIIIKLEMAICPDCTPAITQFPTPKNKTELRSFIGSINFLRRFVKDISAILTPLSKLTFSKVNFNWFDIKENAFNSVKQALSSALVLKFANLTKQFIIESDTSNFAIGAVLLQEFDGIEHPIAYFSYKMLPAEVNYPIYDKELLAIVAALAEWQHHLQNIHHPFLIRTDHKALEYFKSPKLLNQRQACWHYELNLYDFKIEYI